MVFGGLIGVDRSGRLLPTLLCGVVLLVVAACSPTSRSDSDERSEVSVAAASRLSDNADGDLRLDGDVTGEEVGIDRSLPLSLFNRLLDGSVPTADVERVVDSYVGDCMVAAGFEYVPLFHDFTVVGQMTTVGDYLDEYERDGFGVYTPVSPEDQLANEKLRETIDQADIPEVPPERYADYMEALVGDRNATLEEVAISLSGYEDLQPGCLKEGSALYVEQIGYDALDSTLYSDLDAGFDPRTEATYQESVDDWIGCMSTAGYQYEAFGEPWQEMRDVRNSGAADGISQEQAAKLWEDERLLAVASSRCYITTMHRTLLGLEYEYLVERAEEIPELGPFLTVLDPAEFQ